MAISIGNILGAVTQIQTGFANSEGEKSLLDFLNKIDKYGVNVRARYEANFSGIKDITFFITDINTPDLRQNFGTVFFEGKNVEIPINIEYGHDMTLTLLNDAKGVVYSTIVNWLMNQDSGESIVNSGYTMTLRSLGDGGTYKGLTIVLEGVRMRSISGLNFSSSDSNVSTFSLGLSVISFKVTMGSLQKVAGIAGAIHSIIK